LGTGNGTFASITKYSFAGGSLTLSVVLCDFNDDTLLHIVVGNAFDYNIGVFAGYGNGSFAA
jgi:hypothetical protein